MAIDAKINFLNQTEKRLSSEVTANVMTRVLSIVADVLDGYDMREIFTNDEQDDYLRCYIDALKVQGRSAKTVERYRYVITRAMDAIKVPARRVTVYHLRSYLAAEQERGISDSTTEGTRQVLRAYFGWLHREGLIERNPTTNLGAIKCAKKKKQTFSNVDMENMKRHCACERDRAIILFLASTGCRISEVTGLNREDLDFHGLKCIVHGKGNKERTAFFDQVTAFSLKRYLAERTDANPALFVTRFGQRIEPGGVRVMLNELGRRAGVEHVHPHKFRRTLATDLARHGMPIQEIAVILGHEKIDTTMKYVVQNDEDVKNDYRRFAM